MAEQNHGDNNAELRMRAEQRLQDHLGNTADFSIDDAKRLIHELHVHQIELELQNEELRITQLALDSSRRRYSDLYEFSPVGLLTLDTDERIQEANLTFVTLIGIDREKLIERQFSDFVDPSAQDTYHFFYQSLRRTQQPQQCEIILLVPNQPPMAIRLDATVLVQAGIPIAYRIAVSDITLQKQTESQRVELAAERQRTKVLADFVRDISHELRTPITVISTGLYLIGKTVDKEKQLEKIQAVQEQLLYLISIMDQLQQMAILDNTVDLTLRMGNLNQLLSPVLQVVQSLADLKQVQLIEHLQIDLPHIYFHAMTMDQALNILLNNALQFTMAGGIIRVATYEEKSNVVVEVSDNGIGIEADRLPHIFDRLFKADESRHLRSGAGLGLPMAKRIIELHYGSIEVSSTPGVKTVFKVSLPSPKNDSSHVACA